MRHVILSLVILLCSALPGSADTVLIAPSDPMTPGETVRVQIMFTNPAADARDINIPTVIGYRLTGNNTDVTGDLRLADGAAAGVKTLNAESFVQHAYAFEVPQQSSGLRRLTLELTDSPVALVEIADAPIQLASHSLADKPGTPSQDPDPCAQCERETISGDVLPAPFQTHEPLYFLLGLDPLEAKLQFSFKYRVFGKAGTKDENWLNGFHLGYSQTSFWDLDEESRPFRDSSYRPEIFYDFANRKSAGDPLFPGLGLQHVRVGAVHESNGRASVESRSMNYVYAQPHFAFPLPGWAQNNGGEGEWWELAVAPKVWAYVLDRADNEDIDDFRGNAEVMVRVMQRDQDRQSGPGLAATFRKGNLGNKGSVQIDATYPLPLTSTEVYPMLYAQLFTGYGESLLGYNQKNTRLRVGIGTRW